MGVHDIASIVRVHIQLLGFHSLTGRNDLCQILKEDPLKLFSLASKSKSNKGIGVDVYQNPSKHQEKATFLLRLGYAKNSDDMSKALKQFRGRGDQLQERFDCLVRAGLESDVVTNMIKQAPSVLNQTKDVLEKKIDYLRSYLGYPLDSVVVFPSYLCYDMDRIHLRFSMYVWLRNKGAAKPRLSLSTILACSDSRFMKYFVAIQPQGPTMWETLKKNLTLKLSWIFSAVTFHKCFMLGAEMLLFGIWRLLFS
ncbi:hypothetical protein Nepgr_023785 [Nepenthes gracilis]|uniref:Uncharacterized protein n=1 Tax=Nepenthes gracilis TaxID=150966 RepID=A0AAD3XY06_NEPGR|nr:hypothetical protein Nepgr_023785 [Nepenthes gracilis]